MDESIKLQSLTAGELAIRLRRHSLIVREPDKFPGWAIVYPTGRPGEVAAYPILVKDMQISGKLAEIIRRRLGLPKDKFWPQF